MSKFDDKYKNLSARQIVLKLYGSVMLFDEEKSLKTLLLKKLPEEIERIKKNGTSTEIKEFLSFFVPCIKSQEVLNELREIEAVRWEEELEETIASYKIKRNGKGGNENGDGESSDEDSFSDFFRT